MRTAHPRGLLAFSSGPLQCAPRRKPTAAGRWSTANWVIGLLIYAIGGLFLGTVVRMPRGLDGCALPCGPR